MNEATSTGESNTSSTVWSNKVSISINTASNSRVLVVYGFEIKHSSGNNHSGYGKVIGNNTSFVGGDYEVSNSESSYERYNGTILDIGSHSGTRTYKIQFRASSSGYGYIRNAFLCLIEMSV